VTGVHIPSSSAVASIIASSSSALSEMSSSAGSESVGLSCEPTDVFPNRGVGRDIVKNVLLVEGKGDDPIHWYSTDCTADPYKDALGSQPHNGQDIMETWGHLPNSWKVNVAEKKAIPKDVTRVELAVYIPVWVDLRNIWHFTTHWIIPLFHTLEPYLTRGVKPLFIVAPSCPFFRTCDTHCQECDIKANQFPLYQMLFSWGFDYIWYWDIKNSDNRRTFLIDELLVGFDSTCSIQADNGGNLRQCLADGVFDRYKQFLVKLLKLNVTADPVQQKERDHEVLRVTFPNRQEALNRRIVNYDEFQEAVKDVLQKSGINYTYESVQLEKLTHREQIEKMLQTGLMISYRGAADIHTMHMRMGSGFLSMFGSDESPWSPLPGLEIKNMFVYATLADGPPYYCGYDYKPCYESSNWTHHKIDLGRFREVLRGMLCHLISHLSETQFCVGLG